MYRQGDVLIVSVDEIPQSAKKRVTRRIVLAEGEATGHAHTITSDDVEQFFTDVELFLKIDAPAEVVHQEHDTITVPPGLYRVVRQREYAPGEIRRVAD